LVTEVKNHNYFRKQVHNSLELENVWYQSDQNQICPSFMPKI